MAAGCHSLRLSATECDWSPPTARRRYEGTAGAHAIGGRKLRLCANEVLLLLARRGFEVLESRVGEECQYTQDPASMLQHVFGCLYFVARKLPEGTPD